MINDHGMIVEKHGPSIAKWKRWLSYLKPVPIRKSVVYIDPPVVERPERSHYHGCATFTVNRDDTGEYVLEGIVRREGKVFFRLMEKDSDRVFLLNKDLFQRLFRKKEG